MNARAFATPGRPRQPPLHVVRGKRLEILEQLCAVDACGLELCAGRSQDEQHRTEQRA